MVEQVGACSSYPINFMYAAVVELSIANKERHAFGKTRPGLRILLPIILKH